MQSESAIQIAVSVRSITQAGFYSRVEFRIRCPNIGRIGKHEQGMTKSSLGWCFDLKESGGETINVTREWLDSHRTDWESAAVYLALKQIEQRKKVATG